MLSNSLCLQVTQSTEMSLASAAITLHKVGQKRWAHTRAEGGSARESLSTAQKMVPDRAKLRQFLFRNPWI